MVTKSNKMSVMLFLEVYTTLFIVVFFIILPDSDDSHEKQIKSSLYLGF